MTPTTDTEQNQMYALNDAISQWASNCGQLERWDQEEADSRLDEATHFVFNLLTGRSDDEPTTDLPPFEPHAAHELTYSCEQIDLYRTSVDDGVVVIQKNIESNVTDEHLYCEDCHRKITLPEVEWSI